MGPPGIWIMGPVSGVFSSHGDPSLADGLSVEKKTLSTALGFDPWYFDCRSTALTTELHRCPTSPSPQEDLVISPGGSAFLLNYVFSKYACTKNIF